MRPSEVDVLLGDASKARQQLNWEPSVTLEAMVAEMVDADIRAAQAGTRAGKVGRRNRDVA